MGDIHNTQFFRTVQDNKLDVSEVLEQVYAALTERGLYYVRRPDVHHQP